jgi:branched-chain amino acid transport system permease protein
MILKEKVNRPNLYLRIIIIAGLLIFPFFNDSRSMLILLTQIIIFAIFAMSYDILLGYTGIVSFGHCLFFGIGAYSTAIMLSTYDNTTEIFLLSIGVSSILAIVVSYFIGMLSLRLQSHFYAMLTLGFSELFFIVAEKWRSFTQGGDGFTFRVPDILRDRFTFYFFVLISLFIIFLILRLFTSSSTGKVLKAISQNEYRVEALGFHVLHYKIIASIVAGVIAAYSGLLYAVSLRFVDPSFFSIEVTLDALLMTMIGGVGTLIGPILGSGIVELFQHYLSELGTRFPIFERWTLFLGLLYIVVILVFPKGIIGTIKVGRQKIKKKRVETQLKQSIEN